MLQEASAVRAGTHEVEVGVDSGLALGVGSERAVHREKRERRRRMRASAPAGRRASACGRTRSSAPAPVPADSGKRSLAISLARREAARGLKRFTRTLGWGCSNSMSGPAPGPGSQSRAGTRRAGSRQFNELARNQLVKLKGPEQIAAHKHPLQRSRTVVDIREQRPPCTQQRTDETERGGTGHNVILREPAKDRGTPPTPRSRTDRGESAIESVNARSGRAPCRRCARAIVGGADVQSDRA